MGIFVSDMPHFPGQKLALYIFEPRYRVLINQAMIGNRQFLIVSTLQMDIATGRRALLDVPLRLTGNMGDRRAVVAVRASSVAPTASCAHIDSASETDTTAANAAPASPAPTTPTLTFVPPRPPPAARASKRPRLHAPDTPTPAPHALDAFAPLGFAAPLSVHSPPQPDPALATLQPRGAEDAADALASDVPAPQLSPAPSLALSARAFSTSPRRTLFAAPPAPASSQSSLTVPQMLPTPSQLADMDPHPYGALQDSFAVPWTLEGDVPHHLATALRDGGLLRGPFAALAPPPTSAYAQGAERGTAAEPRRASVAAVSAASEAVAEAGAVGAVGAAQGNEDPQVRGVERPFATAADNIDHEADNIDDEDVSAAGERAHSRNHCDGAAADASRDATIAGSRSEDPQSPAAPAAPLAPLAREWTYALSLAQYLSLCTHADRHLASAAAQLRRRLHGDAHGDGPEGHVHGEDTPQPPTATLHPRMDVTHPMRGGFASLTFPFDAASVMGDMSSGPDPFLLAQSPARPATHATAPAAARAGTVEPRATYGLSALPAGACVGVVATVDSCQSYPDGRLLVQATGARRVLVRSVRSEGGRYGLWSGEFEPYEDLSEAEEVEREEAGEEAEEEGASDAVPEGNEGGDVEDEEENGSGELRRRRGKMLSLPSREDSVVNSARDSSRNDSTATQSNESVSTIALPTQVSTAAAPAADDLQPPHADDRAALQSAPSPRSARAHARLALLCAEVEWLAAQSLQQLRVGT